MSEADKMFEELGYTKPLVAENVYKADRKIIIFSGMYDDDEDGKKVEPMLYDLIQAGLVEKVEG